MKEMVILVLLNKNKEYLNNRLEPLYHKILIKVYKHHNKLSLIVSRLLSKKINRLQLRIQILLVMLRAELVQIQLHLLNNSIIITVKQDKDKEHPRG